ncbi:MAG: hypothetical protein IPO02_10700 [Bacteroidetes bacterium]|nr:hypothetical protein [Bacteroidota bacterium]
MELLGSIYGKVVPARYASEGAWSLQNFIITAYIKSNFRVRFGHEIGSGGAFTVGSWNIDDITFTGTTPPATIAWTMATITSPTW